MNHPQKRNWLDYDLGGARLFRICLYGVLLMVITIFAANYPAGLPNWRFFGAEAALAAIILMNVLTGRSWSSESPKDARIFIWSFLILSVSLILATMWLSDQLDLAYLLSLVCIQADFMLGVWPSGAIFSLVNLAAWFFIQIELGLTASQIMGRESALAVGIVFGFLVVALLQRSTRQTKLAQDLLADLQVAHHELENAQQKEKELAVAEERVRLARDLHDSVTQSLYSVNLYAGAAADHVKAGNNTKALEHLGNLQTTAQDALREMRQLIFELRRPDLATSGLVSTVQSRLESVEARCGVKTYLSVEGTEHTLPIIQMEIYNIIQEALNNTLKHAHACSVQVGLHFNEDCTVAEVCDDGVGFEPDDSLLAGGFGLKGMRERAQKIGAELQIESAPNQGTRIRVRASQPPTQQVVLSTLDSSKSKKV